MGELDLFVITAPGLESVTGEELRALGVADVARETGGLSFRTGPDVLARLNLELRTASRIVVRLGAFRVRALGELERRAARLPWERFLSANRSLDVRVTTRKSRLFHTGAIAERIGRGASARLGRDVTVSGGTGEPEDPGDAQLVVVRMLHDECTLSMDSSGALLHRRGYRQAIARAPMRETLAAAMLLAAGYRGEEPLLDPMCGSGTIPIEGALLARDMPPGARRDFAFTHWPDFDDGAWRTVRDAAIARARAAAPSTIAGCDRDRGAIEAATANAGRAGVAGDIAWRVAALSTAQPSCAGEGWLVVNPPYGVRIGDERRLRDLYARLGQVARARFVGWRVVMLSASPQLAAQTGLPWEELLCTRTGGLAVRVLMARA